MRMKMLQVIEWRTTSSARFIEHWFQVNVYIGE